jgi:hypothetical protein
MSTVSEIREAIRRLPAKEAWQLAGEFRDYLDALWDQQFEADVQAGRLDKLIARAREELPQQKVQANGIRAIPESFRGRCFFP